MSKEIEIADLIEKFIREGTWKAGEKIPSEHELSELYQVNHKTANKAVAKLVERGLIVRTVGRGGSKVATTLPAKRCNCLPFAFAFCRCFLRTNAERRRICRKSRQLRYQIL